MSAASGPPYNPNVSSAGIPSIWASGIFPEKEHGAFPNIISPPQRPLSFSSKFVPAVWPISILSEEEVKITHMQEQLEWYQTELNLNPLSWGKKKRKRK